MYGTAPPTGARPTAQESLFPATYPQGHRSDHHRCKRPALTFEHNIQRNRTPNRFPLLFPAPIVHPEAGQQAPTGRKPPHTFLSDLTAHPPQPFPREQTTSCERGAIEPALPLRPPLQRCQPLSRGRWGPCPGNECPCRPSPFMPVENVSRALQAYYYSCTNTHHRFLASRCTHPFPVLQLARPHQPAAANVAAVTADGL